MKHNDFSANGFPLVPTGVEVIGLVTWETLPPSIRADLDTEGRPGPETLVPVVAAAPAGTSGIEVQRHDKGRSKGQAAFICRWVLASALSDDLLSDAKARLNAEQARGADERAHGKRESARLWVAQRPDLRGEIAVTDDLAALLRREGVAHLIPADVLAVS